MKFAWMDRREFPLAQCCAVFSVSRSGYYAWKRSQRIPRPGVQRRQGLKLEIAQIHEQSRRVYGSPRVYRELLGRGVNVCENTVARLMRASQIRSKRVRRFVPRTTDAQHNEPVSRNVLDRDFKAQAPNRKWASDITYVRTGEGWLYVAVTLDLYSRKVVGWSMAEHLRTELVTDALHMAVQRRRPGAGLIHHSDRGIQYASQACQELLKQLGCQGSMSRSGDCYDNAVVESFWSTLKTELVYHREYATRQEARSEIFEYLEVFYNRIRRHSTLKYLSPEAFEALPN